MLPVIVQAQFTYTTNNGALTITGYSGSGGDLVIPSSINGYEVTAIANNAFNSTRTITAITIADTLTSIGVSACANCSGLRSVQIGTGVHTLPGGVFINCSSLTNLVLSDRVVSFGSSLFENCSNLANIQLPTSLTNIDWHAFRSCTSIKSITLPETLVSIHSEAFLNCTNLTDVCFMGSAPKVGIGAFNGSKVVSVYYIPGTTGWDASFSGIPTVPMFDYTASEGIVRITRCSAPMRTLRIPATLYGLPVAAIGDGAFFACGRLVSITIPSSIINIGSTAFASCTNLTNVTMSDGVGSIGSYAFIYCRSLGDVTLPASVTTIGDYAFKDCGSLTRLYFMGNAPSVGGNTFVDATNVTAYYLPGTTTWNPTFAGRPTELWKAQIQTGDSDFGVHGNKFCFIANWASGRAVVVEGCTNLANPTWSVLQTNIFTNGTMYFSDPQWSNYPSRVYRIRCP